MPDRFSESEPGVRLTDVLLELQYEDVVALLPNGMEEALKALDPDARNPEGFRRAAADVMDVHALLRNRATRTKLLSVLPEQKLKEVSSRVGVPPQNVAVADYDEDELRALVGFFGEAVQGEEFEQTVEARAEIEPTYGLFPYQRQAVTDIEAYLDDPMAVLPSAFLHMPTGSGKTRTAMHAIARHLVSSEPSIVVWLADSRELLLQASEEFGRAWKLLGDRQVTIVQYWGEVDAIEAIKDGISVCGLQKLWRLWQRDGQAVHNFAHRVDYVVVDEAHISVADTYSSLISILRRTPETKLLGLSATPGRTWNDPGSDAELAKLYDRNKVTISVEGYDSPVSYLIEEGYLAEPEFRMLNIEGGASPSIKGEYRDEDRGAENDVDLSADQRTSYLMAVVREVRRLKKRHKRILVFGASVPDAKNIALLLRREEIEADVITGRTPRRKRDTIIRRYQRGGEETRVIVNYGVLTAGFDAPSTSAAVIARPTQSLVLYSQMVGRAIRGPRAGGNRWAEIVTIVDPKLPGFGSVAEAFTNWEDVW